MIDKALCSSSGCGSTLDCGYSVGGAVIDGNVIQRLLMDGIVVIVENLQVDGTLESCEVYFCSTM